MAAPAAVHQHRPNPSFKKSLLLGRNVRLIRRSNSPLRRYGFITAGGIRHTSDWQQE